LVATMKKLFTALPLRSLLLAFNAAVVALAFCAVEVSALEIGPGTSIATEVGPDTPDVGEPGGDLLAPSGFSFAESVPLEFFPAGQAPEEQGDAFRSPLQARAPPAFPPFR
jgi:hypothetical protein